MKILALSDIHGEVKRLCQIADPLREADLILLTGDLTNFGGSDKVLQILDILSPYNSQILAVHGNCDLPSVEAVLEEKGISLNGRCVTLSRIWFVGVGGSLPCPGITPSGIGESVFEEALESAISAVQVDQPLVLVTHQPPYGTKIDAVSGRHTGSRAIRRFIEKYHPVLSVSGHIHEAPGLDKLEKTVLLNPGPFCKGFYATLEINGLAVSVQCHRTE